MTQNTRTLGSIKHSTQQQMGQDTQSQTSDSNSIFQAYLTLFALNLSQRYPNVTDLDQIDYDSVRSLSEFSDVCSVIAIDTWNERHSTSSVEKTVSQRQRLA